MSGILMLTFILFMLVLGTGAGLGYLICMIEHEDVLLK